MSQGKVAKAQSSSTTYELEKSVFVVAVADGYYRNRYWREGEKFQYGGRVKKDKDGNLKLPLWIKLDESAVANELKLKGSKPAPKPKAKVAEKKVNKVSDLV